MNAVLLNDEPAVEKKRRKKRPYVRKVEPVEAWVHDEGREIPGSRRVVGYRVVVVDLDDKVRQRSICGNLVDSEWAAKAVLRLFSKRA